MSHDDTQRDAAASDAERRAPEAADQPGDADRPDHRGPRGNPDAEAIDVERGEGKIERVLGW